LTPNPIGHLHRKPKYQKASSGKNNWNFFAE
jgi:hypothetical protein